MRRLVIAAAVGAAVVGAAVPSLASTATKQSVPVYVWRTSDGAVCFAVSEQVPHCVDPSPVTDIFPGEFGVGPLTVDISTANGGVAVGTALNGDPLLGAYVANGQACVGVSLQLPICVPLR